MQVFSILVSVVPEQIFNIYFYSYVAFPSRFRLNSFEGYSGNFWIVVCRWDSDILTLYQCMLSC